MLVQVLVTSVIVAVLAAGLLQMVVMNHTILRRSTAGAAARKQAEGAFNKALAYWNQNGYYPCQGTLPGYTASAATPCACTLTPASSADPVITASGGVSSCKVVTDAAIAP